jgi:hypothetical protein
MDLYIHSPIRLHGIVFNLLSTRITLPLFRKMIPEILLNEKRCTKNGIIINGFEGTGVWNLAWLSSCWACPPSGILGNTMFRKLDIFPSSDERSRGTYFAESVRKRQFPSLAQFVQISENKLFSIFPPSTWIRRPISFIRNFSTSNVPCGIEKFSEATHFSLSILPS